MVHRRLKHHYVANDSIYFRNVGYIYELSSFHITKTQMIRLCNIFLNLGMEFVVVNYYLVFEPLDARESLIMLFSLKT